MPDMLVNALSVTNQSGRHVLAGHLVQLTDGLRGRLRFVVLCRQEQEELRRALGDRVDWTFAPAATQGWLYRALWERRQLSRLAHRLGATLYFTPSGIAAHLPAEVKQVVFCQNPWALAPAARRGRDFFKAWLQRRAYRRAMRTAAVMVFNSRYMQAAYRANAGFQEKQGLVAYQAPDDETRARAAALADIPRRPGQIVCVSAMGRHKNAEAVVQALRRVRARHPEARLVFAGAWPDPNYEHEIRDLVAALELADAVEFKGHLPRAELDRLYAESRVFCLPSRCESFGIPAVEAQLFGTPVVGAAVCAMPEIGGAGGVFCDPDDVAGLATALERLLTDDAEWRRLSDLARQNAARFAWSHVSRPLIALFAECATGTIRP